MPIKKRTTTHKKKASSTKGRGSVKKKIVNYPPSGQKVTIRHLEYQPTPRIISSAEKRQLILAHAAARETLEPVSQTHLWAGVVISAIFVLTAWVFTVGSNLFRTWDNPLDSVKPKIEQFYASQ